MGVTARGTQRHLETICHGGHCCSSRRHPTVGVTTGTPWDARRGHVPPSPSHAGLAKPPWLCQAIPVASSCADVFQPHCSLLASHTAEPLKLGAPEGEQEDRGPPAPVALTSRVPISSPRAVMGTLGPGKEGAGRHRLSPVSAASIINH